MRRVISAISRMKSSRDIAPRSIRASFHSHSPVSSGAVSSGMPSPLSRVIREKALAVGSNSRPSRRRYCSASRFSMIWARVAGVPRPRPAIAARSSSSSMVLPAPSIAVRRVASE
ncbi:MAG: hypothetical protein AW07_01504 [Candidatus Accumulibacter sp. SK-11]|nr:MAG: hypothetical protein AW07_01504 [Candidatus Accumulibacter sp. SK-11]